ncbi:multidrug effflux MFS transporter [Cellulophaga sp. HaHaR_3_176]|uniref:multidrug effflux MFS transporter n=1 Tax=Cellulophaga sp. HaHaR_3_176 TaxID=1942464 RepID=UPI001C1FD09C|nr:multidrug effflux MFS transporter [Cellulophaga sp. HaHaR_3_176]QWX85612.1 multidrug effflux MFS transporter [Cellulophaga sp. HaHaR_3_176]
MQEKQSKPNFEFIALMASLMSIVALSIDALLPALSNIGVSINNSSSTDHQLLITMIFLGLGVGQLFFGPLSDTYGRKPIIYIGFSVFIIASIICVFATSLEVMIVGRILQGIGLSAARTISISIIRDTFEGNYMAKVMSFVTAFFILVPVVAPAFGKIILESMGWKAIFFMQIFFSLIIGFWFWKRQPETLHPEFKVPFTKTVFIKGIKELIKHKETIACTMISGLITGAFLVYLSSAQHVFEDQYNLKETFPYLFAALAVSIGLSTFFNGTLVLRFGMRKLAFIALISFTTLSLIYVAMFWGGTNPSIGVLMVFLSMIFFSLGFIWGNMRSIAMEPIGHIAGIGAAITGFISTLISIPIATFIGSYVTDTVLPLFMGLGACGVTAIILFLIFRQPASEVVKSI